MADLAGGAYGALVAFPANFQGRITWDSGEGSPVYASAAVDPIDLGTVASLADPGEASGEPTTLLGMLRRLFERSTNTRTRNRTTGVVVLRNAADGANLESWTQSSAPSGPDTLDTIGAAS